MLEYLEVRTDNARYVVSVSGADQAMFQNCVNEHFMTQVITELAEMSWRMVGVVQTVEKNGYLYYFERKMA